MKSITQWKKYIIGLIMKMIPIMEEKYCNIKMKINACLYNIQLQILSKFALQNNDPTTLFLPNLLTKH